MNRHPAIEEHYQRQRERARVELIAPLLPIVQKVDIITREERLPLQDLVAAYHEASPPSADVRPQAAVEALTAAFAYLRDFGYLESEYLWGVSSAGKSAMAEAGLSEQPN